MSASKHRIVIITSDTSDPLVHGSAEGPMESRVSHRRLVPCDSNSKRRGATCAVSPYSGMGILETQGADSGESKLKSGGAKTHQLGKRKRKKTEE